jgi:hypothetical protein
LLPRIDRIILYIDDLDRCPEDKVVEVLQAIHLLLFFPLFVVVVGVDSRWLLHSLQQQTRIFQAGMENGPGSQVERTHWESTPLNYLEKNFQIPFAIRPMPLDGFQNLLDNLTEPQSMSGRSVQVPRQPSDTPAVPDSGIASAVSKVGTEQISENEVSLLESRSTADVAINVPKVVHQRVFDPNPEYLRLSDCEREFMKLLHPLIPSPRATKRFVNIYRILRSSVTAGEEPSFVSADKDGDYKAVQLLLAIQTGYPNQAVEIIRDLIEQTPRNSWWSFVDGYHAKYRNRPIKRPKVSAVNPTKLPEELTASPLESDRWMEFLEHVNLLRSDLPDRSCTGFAKWAPRVARYSFQSARVLQFVTPTSGSLVRSS